MCLFKRDQKDTNCGHEECKKFYALNKQLCVYNLNPQSNPIPIFHNQNLLLQTPNQIKQFPQVTLTPEQLNYQPPLNVKRPQLVSDGDEAELGLLNKKKLKTKEEGQVIENQQSQQPLGELNTLGFTDLSSLAQQPIVGDNRNFFNQQLLNNLLLSNNQQSMPKLENQTQQLTDIFGGLLQNPQQNIMLNLLNGQPGAAALNLNQILPQNMQNMQTMQNIKPKINHNGTTMELLNEENKLKIEHTTTCEEFMKDFQAKSMSLLSTQSKMLVELKEKNDMLQETLALLIGEINNIKNSLSHISREKGSTTNNNNNPIILHQNLANSTETVSVETLITYLYGPKPEFEYHLVLKNDLPLPLYRERNFKFTVLLVDNHGNIVENSNRIPLTIGIYSSENPPKYIDSNTAGNKILKGFIEKDMVNGAVTFEKIQIKEVTSHFRNGWIFFVVYPKINKSANNTVLYGGNGVNVNVQKIKPLILEKVIVKAKKTKERDQGGDYDNSPSSPHGQNESIKEETIYE